MAKDGSNKGNNKGVSKSLPTDVEVQVAADKRKRNQDSAKMRHAHRAVWQKKLANMSKEARAKLWEELNALRKAGGLTLQQCGEWDFLNNPKLFAPQIPSV